MKLKTHKAASKRFWKSGSGKIRRRRSGQDHFNMREPSKVTRWKRRDNDIPKSNPKIAKLIPY